MPVRYLSDPELARLSGWQDESDVAARSASPPDQPSEITKAPRDPFRCYGDPLFGAITDTPTTVRIRIHPLLFLLTAGVGTVVVSAVVRVPPVGRGRSR
jgi:hypothetical protein